MVDSVSRTRGAQAWGGGDPGLGGPRNESTFDRVYSLIVAGKGLYGVLELFAGCMLLLVPGVTGQLLTAAAMELAEGSVALRDAASRSLAAAGAGVAAGAVPIALFLIVHGVVKVLTAFALLRRAIRWYPWALGALGVLLIVQAVDLTLAPSIGGGILAVLDVAVIALVTWEYRRLRRDADSSDVLPAADLSGAAHAAKPAQLPGATS